MTARKVGAQPVAAPWTAQDIATSARMWKELITDLEARGECVLGRKDAACAAIGAALGRTPMAIKGRYRDYGVGFCSHASSYGQTDLRLDREAEQEREALLRARARQPPTAALFGDPPPGYSALDRRRQGVAP